MTGSPGSPKIKEKGATGTLNASDAWDAPSWKHAATWYHAEVKKNGRVLIVEPQQKNWDERREHVAASTLAAAEYLAKQNDPARLDAWLAKRTPNEAAAIVRHLEGAQR